MNVRCTFLRKKIPEARRSAFGFRDCFLFAFKQRAEDSTDNLVADGAGCCVDCIVDNLVDDGFLLTCGTGRTLCSSALQLLAAFLRSAFALCCLCSFGVLLGLLFGFLCLGSGFGLRLCRFSTACQDFISRFTVDAVRIFAIQRTGSDFLLAQVFTANAQMLRGGMT